VGSIPAISFSVRHYGQPLIPPLRTEIDPRLGTVCILSELSTRESFSDFLLTYGLAIGTESLNDS
jgi:hypothetical protein